MNTINCMHGYKDEVLGQAKSNMTSQTFYAPSAVYQYWPKELTGTRSAGDMVGVTSSIPARSYTSAKIDYEIIPADSRRVLSCTKYNCSQACPGKMVVCRHGHSIKNQHKPKLNGHPTFCR